MTDSSFEPPIPVDLQRRLLSEKRNGSSDDFAVLIGLNTELRHQANISIAYQVLLERGYSAKNIFILDTSRSAFFPTIDITSRASIVLLFSYLTDIMDSSDTLVVYVTGHGIRDGNRSYMMLNPSERMRNEEFVSILHGLELKSGLLFVDECYAGNSMLSDCRWTTITVSTDERTTTGNAFPRIFWQALRDGHGLIDSFDVAMRLDPHTSQKYENRPVMIQCDGSTPLLSVPLLR